MTAPSPTSQRLRVAHLNPNAPTPFDLRPDDATCQAVAGDLGLSGLSKLVMRGEIRSEGPDDWVLNARLTAKVVQQCVITLKPVKAVIDAKIHRHYTLHFPENQGDEVEMPDETLEPLGPFIDLTGVMTEELALALPEYPRAKDASLPEDMPEGETRRPFANLGKLLNDRNH